MDQFNGVQLKPTIGTNFNSQYHVPDTGLTQTTTLQNNPMYNMLQVLFKGKQTDNISQFNHNDTFLQNGLKQNPVEAHSHKLFTKA